MTLVRGVRNEDRCAGNPPEPAAAGTYRCLRWRRALPAGCAGLIAGPALGIGRLAASSLALLVAGVVIAGFSQGLSFGAGFAAVNAESPAQRRSEVASSFFVVGCVRLSLPIIGVRVAAEAFGLRAAGIGCSAIVAGLALTALVSLTQRS